MSRNQYITDYLNPLEKEGIIKDIHDMKDGSFIFSLKTRIKGRSIICHLIPGSETDYLFFHIGEISDSSGGTMFRLASPSGDNHYADILKMCINEAIKDIKEMFNNPLPE